MAINPLEVKLAKNGGFVTHGFYVNMHTEPLTLITRGLVVPCTGIWSDGEEAVTSTIWEDCTAIGDEVIDSCD